MCTGRADVTYVLRNGRKTGSANMAPVDLYGIEPENFSYGSYKM